MWELCILCHRLLGSDMYARQAVRQRTSQKWEFLFLCLPCQYLICQFQKVAMESQSLSLSSCSSVAHHKAHNSLQSLFLHLVSHSLHEQGHAAWVIHAGRFCTQNTCWLPELDPIGSLRCKLVWNVPSNLPTLAWVNRSDLPILMNLVSLSNQNLGPGDQSSRVHHFVAWSNSIPAILFFAWLYVCYRFFFLVCTSLSSNPEPMIIHFWVQKAKRTSNIDKQSISISICIDCIGVSWCLQDWATTRSNMDLTMAGLTCHDLSKEVSEAERQEASELESAQRVKAKLIAGPFGQETLWESSLRSMTEQ